MIEQLTWRALFVMELAVGFDRARRLGPTPAGERSVYPVDGGTFAGERLRGLVEPGGADWVTHRADGSTIIDVRLTLATDDGALIGMTYTGLAPARSLAGAGDAGGGLVHTTPRFETGDPRYAWINGVVAVTNGVRTPGGGVYHVFAIG